MDQTLNLLSTVGLDNETITANEVQHSGITLRLSYQAPPDQTHRPCPPLFLSADQARTLAQALLTAADRIPAPAKPAPHSH